MRRRKRSKFFLGLACAFLVVLGARAADVIIQLRNGDRLTGAIAAESPTEVTLQTATLGKITIPVGQILKREEVVAASSKPPSATSTNTVAVTTSTNKPAASPTTAAVAAKPKAPKHWNTELQFGLNLRYSATEQQEALVVAKSTYSNKHFREILDYNFTYGRTEGIKSANRMTGNAKTEYDLSPRSYLFGLAGAGYDEIRQIDRQFEVDPGFGYQWVKTPDLVLKTEVGLGYQDQFFKNNAEVNTYSGRLAGIFTWRIYDKLMADGRVEYFQNLLSFDEYRFRVESTLRYPLFKNLSLNLIVIDLYDTQTPPGVQNNDLQVRSALGIKF